MSSAVILGLLRCGRSAVARQSIASSRSSTDASVASVQVGGALLGMTGVRRASGSARFDPDGSGRPVTWDSFGIWDNRIEEPVLLPSSIRYGKPIPQVSLSRVGCASVLGLRKQNEDRLRFARLHDNLLYFAVFDGHGGSYAADYCYTFMEKFIRDALEEEEDLEKVLKKAFLDADKALHTHLSFFNNASVLTAGTTATVAMLRDGVELVVGSVGDSRATLCRKGRADKLTKDHTPDRKDERQRYESGSKRTLGSSTKRTLGSSTKWTPGSSTKWTLGSSTKRTLGSSTKRTPGSSTKRTLGIQKSGGFVTWNSLGQANVNGRLAMTRSIGDFHLRSSGVIAEPDTRRLTVQHANDSFLTLTTDGINFLLSDQEICDVINQCHDPTEAANVIAQQALQYGSEDNATIVIVPFGAWGKHQSSSATYSVSRNLASSGRWA